MKFQRKRLHVFHIPVAFVKADTIIELFAWYMYVQRMCI